MNYSNRDINTLIQEEISKLWNALGTFRRNFTNYESFNLILITLSLYREQSLNKEERINFLLSNGQVEISNPTLDKYRDIIQQFEYKVRKEDINSLFNIYSNIRNDIINHHFPTFFDEVLKIIIEMQGYRGREFFQPLEITQLINSIIDIPKSARVYNPFAGLASYGIFLGNDINYFGQESVTSIWIIGRLRLIAYSKEDKILYLQGNSVENWSKEKYDLIVSTPPFGYKFNNRSGLHTKYRTIEQFVILNSLHNLSENGKLVLITPLGFLFRMKETKSRKHLIDSDLIETVIRLPNNLFTNTSLPVVLIKLNKNRKEKGIIQFVDASSFFEVSNRRRNILKVKELSKEILKKTDSEFTRLVSIREVQEREFNLNVEYYVFDKIEYFERETLGELVDFIEPVKTKFIKSFKTNETSKGKFIRIRDLENDRYNYNLNIEKIEEVELRKGLRKVEESCLLIAAQSKTLKPTYFHYKGEPIFISNNIYAFEINHKIVDLGYLVNELYEDYVLSQVNAFSTGSSLKKISRNDLLKIKIKLIGLEEQKAKSQAFQEVSKKIRSLQKERNQLSHGLKSKVFDEFAALKHSLGTPRQAILSWSTELIETLRNAQNRPFDELNQQFKSFYDIDIINALQNIKENIGQIGRILERSEQVGLDIERYPIDLVTLQEIRIYIKNRSYNHFKFNLEKIPFDKNIEYDFQKKNGIKINKDLLGILLDNILQNADKHGFDKKQKANKVTITLNVLDNNTFELRIKNNGKPFPERFDKQKFTAKNVTTNTEVGEGLGGYHINEIATYFGDKNWELLLNESPVFPVELIFRFPIKPLN